MTLWLRLGRFFLWKGYTIIFIFFVIFRKRKSNSSFEQKIKDFFAIILAERGNRLVIFIDELDRCKPTFAVHLLEQIKHYIFDDRITFVFSINFTYIRQ